MCNVNELKVINYKILYKEIERDTDQEEFDNIILKLSSNV